MKNSLKTGFESCLIGIKSCVNLYDLGIGDGCSSEPLTLQPLWLFFLSAFQQLFSVMQLLLLYSSTLGLSEHHFF